ncbi:phenylacetate--CoA ligase family protein [Gordonia sp. (in: high G+C Gram-positive bacteria)]|uniref:phenylacetate--CoA ligase family protein n=1 Tax=Gordonia sp. (in: high G+C Gram-positive bacteria) TaxID=84139 RepID=UPI003C711DD8
MADDYWDRELDTLPWAEVLDWQRAQLPGFLDALCARSPHHADRLAGVDTARAADPQVWASVPTTDKADLRQAQEDGPEALLGRGQAVPDDQVVQVIASSGTTGTPTFFGLTAHDRQAWEHSIANMYYTAGVRPDSVVAHTVGMPMVAGGLPYADAVRRIGATLVWVGGQTTARIAEIFARLRVDTMICTASYATFLAERIGQESGSAAAELGLRTLIGGGEPGLAQPQIRDGVQAAWGGPRISETMGLGDVMSGMWAECEAGQGMHFTGARNVMVELIDPHTGDPLPWRTGVRGEAVYTTFTREATPVVRYRSKDHMEVVGTECACGRTAPRAHCIGRTDDMLIYKAMNVFPSAIRDVVLDTADGRVAGPLRIRKETAEQVRFEDPIPVEIETAAEGPARTDLAAEIEDAVRLQLRVRIAVEAVPVGSLPVSQYKSPLVYTRS